MYVSASGSVSAREPVRANRVIRVRIEARREHVLEARDCRSARDPETPLGVLHRGAHDSHVRRRYCGRGSEHKVSPGAAKMAAGRVVA